MPTTCHRAFPELISLFSWDLIKWTFYPNPISFFFSLLFIRFLFQLFVASKWPTFPHGGAVVVLTSNVIFLCPSRLSWLNPGPRALSGLSFYVIYLCCDWYNGVVRPDETLPILLRQKITNISNPSCSERQYLLAMWFQPWYPALSHPCVPAPLLVRLEGEIPPVPAPEPMPFPIVLGERFEYKGGGRGLAASWAPHWHTSAAAAAHSAPRSQGCRLHVPGSGRAQALVRHRRGWEHFIPSVPAAWHRAPAADRAICCHAPSWFSPAGAGESVFPPKAQGSVSSAQNPTVSACLGAEPRGFWAAMLMRAQQEPCPTPSRARALPSAGPEVLGQLYSTEQTSLPYLLHFGVFLHCSQWRIQNQSDVLFMRNNY